MSKITIDTIKSEDARFQIENYTTNGRMLSKAAISAVVKAERQADERAVKAFKEFTCEVSSNFAMSAHGLEAVERFKQILNEVQSDE